MITVLIMGAVWSIYNRTLLEQEAERVLIVESDIIGSAARPALMFNDQRMASELLRAMKFDPDISVVKLFTSDGDVLYTYTADDVSPELGKAIDFRSNPGSAFNDGSLHLYRTVTHKEDTVGMIYLESRLNYLQESQNASALTVIMVMAGSLLLGVLLASTLQRRIAKPISSLASVMHKMASKSDYSLRAEEYAYNRETSDLLSGFNRMADEIQNSFAKIEEKNLQLQESERRFRSIIEQVPMPVLISRKSDGKMLFYNQAVAQLLAIDPSASKVFHTLNYYRHPEDRSKVIGKLRDEGTLVGYEMEAVKSDGTPFWISLSVSQIGFEGEEVLCSTFMDITDQKEIEKRLEVEVSERTQELKSARDELQSTLDNMMDVYYRIATDGSVEWVSSAITPLLGYSVDESIGKPMQLFWPDSPPFSEAVAALSANDGVMMNHEIQLQHRQGKTVWSSISAHLVLDGNMEAKAIEGVVRDISLLVEAEERKQEMEKKMAHVQRLESLGVLAGGIAHDFNNILAGIMGNAELAELNQHSNLPVDRELKSIINGSVRAADLCRQMLAYSGQGALIRESVNLSSLVKETVHLIDVSVSKKVAITFDLQADIPPIFADKTQMQQIIMNLITNASESMDEKSSGEIRVSTGSVHAGRRELDSPFMEEKRPEGEYVFLEVIDNGCGMDEQVLGRMFDPFFSTKFTGRGLGMSAVLGIVRSHGGTIHVESSPGSGTRFRALLPVYLEAPAVEVVDGDTDHEELADNNLTILVVDDEAMVRSIFERMFNKLGFKVLLAADGEEGLRCYREHKHQIDAVFLDMTMPKMDGRETLSKMREMGIKVPVVVCSGYRGESVSSQFDDAPPDAFLQKPFSLQSLQQVLGICLNGD
ncbi:PAS domain S-box protein [Mariprofundus ferrinatatus]|uniref:PAS domain S-box protein n=1 Tax=Mariprofundus ferrinatatus TaxID=1921087 RepID=UPI0018E222DA|nr:PAS domain S-box protein [Mariprofundus ferrinatatus]